MFWRGLFGFGVGVGVAACATAAVMPGMTAAPGPRGRVRVPLAMSGPDTSAGALLSIDLAEDGEATFRIEVPSAGAGGGRAPLRWFLPRLDYQPGDPPDAFDARNMMLGEFARSGVRLKQAVPASGVSEVHVANNCLAPGLWEVSFRGREGQELRHGWGTIPEEEYLRWVAQGSGMTPAFLRSALAWRVNPVEPKLDRLRSVVRDAGPVGLELDPGFAFVALTKEAQRKWKAGHVSRKQAQAAPPSGLADLGHPLYFRDFVPPGRYQPLPQKTFDLSWLLEPQVAQVKEVRPLTRVQGRIPRAGVVYGEVTLTLGGYRLCLGNLPLSALGFGRSYRLHGFGVGVPEALATPARRKRREAGGLAPAYAYLMESEAEGGRILNNHDLGIETVELELERGPGPPVLLVTVGAFERVVELARYRVPIPEPLAWKI